MSNRGGIFKSIMVKKPKKSVFDLSHEKKLTCNFGTLVPCYFEEVLPGEKWSVKTEMIAKLAPMIAPVMHRINAYIHYFAVPNRLVWDNWQTFITGGVDGKQAPIHPAITVAANNYQTFGVGSLADYFGIPPFDASPSVARNYSALPFRAYQLIYNEFYRDQTLTPEIVFSKGDGVLGEADSQTIAQIRMRQWEKDYFCSALNMVQRGDDVNIPITANYADTGDSVVDANTQAPYTGAISGGNGTVIGDSMNPLNIENIDSLSATINDLRTSVRLQEWLEKNARAGSRYVEQILAHFNQRVPDYTLQRPQYLGGGKQPIMISEVLANFESSEVAQGQMAGHGLSVGNQAGFKYRSDEHCMIIGILSILPRTGYMNGSPRQLQKSTKFDYAFPEFAHLGEQPVYSFEIYDDRSASTNQDVFAYQSRFAEYKYRPDTISGEFRTSLKHWHLARYFDTRPNFNNSFTESSFDDRIFAIQDESVHKVWIQLYHSVRALRPLPYYGTPIL